MGLRDLAEECGITTSHVDGLGRHIEATDASMLAVLRALGVEIDSPDQADAIRESRAQRAHALVQPCLATVADQNCQLALHGAGDQPFVATLRLESGGTQNFEGVLGELEQWDAGFLLSLGELPAGYHRVSVQCGDREATCHLLAAPSTAYGAPGSKKSWGLFAPLYALRGSQDYGVGDLACLGRMMDWASSLGASFVGTLPLLASNYKEDFQTSPYSPVSRLFWNEIYLDLQSLGDTYASEELSSLLALEETQNVGRALSELSLVDYAGSSAFRRKILSCIAKTAWQNDAATLERALREQPELHRYAAFRAMAETTGKTWPKWPEQQAKGTLDEGDYDQDIYRYHVFAQWAADRQLATLADKDCNLYLDLSVGAAGSSYDVWRYQETFVKGIDVGAPPDGLFAGGQNWALPPLHPEGSREQGHEYFARCVRAHMRHSGMLRIDHVMGLHRLYWVPSELGATEGLYVRYPADELYAILLIESHRQKSLLVGEDLGTVPDSVRPAMERAGMHRLYVGQFSTEWREHEQFLGLEQPPESAIASLDTHDTATFAGWFDTTDLKVEAEALMRAWTEELASGPAAGLVVTMEDLWLEREPQNRPGTGQEEPNWRRRIARSLDEIFADEHIVGWLRYLSDLRSQAQNR